MGLFSREKPKIKVQTSKKDGFSGWLKCTHCNELIHANELQKNSNCCPKCDYHYRLSSDERLKSLADANTFKILYDNLHPVDVLKFVDTEPYPERLVKAKEKSGHDEAVLVGTCEIKGHAVAIGIMDFNFMGASMGSVVGERLTLIIEHALANRLPLIIVSTSGGARMQESTLSLMQMAKTSAALARLDDARIPYISILTNPTTGGVTASFASLGDVIIAEPNALIGFAGPRVIEQVIGQKLPAGAQQSEFLLKHGMVDRIVRRHDLKNEIAGILEIIGYAEDSDEMTAKKSKNSKKTPPKRDTL